MKYNLEQMKNQDAIMAKWSNVLIKKTTKRCNEVYALKSTSMNVLDAKELYERAKSMIREWTVSC